jgi:hypothetical protein
VFTKIGQAVYKSPTAFSFFLPEFSPEGPVSSAGLVAPEAQLDVLRAAACNRVSGWHELSRF